MLTHFDDAELPTRKPRLGAAIGSGPEARPTLGIRLAEKAILQDVLRAGEILQLRDGRRLVVANRGDATAASIWFPGVRLLVKKGRRGQLVIENEDTGETISAKCGTARTR